MELTKVRMREHSGIVTNDTSTSQFSFVVSPLKNRAQVEQKDYIALPHPTLGETCPVIATIKEIKGYEQIVGSTLSEQVGRMMATAQIIGYVDTKGETKQIQTLHMPPNPGSRVYLLYSEFLQEVFSTDLNGKPFNPPLHIGETIQTALTQKEDTKQLHYHLDPKNLTKAHTIITAMDGFGKTHLAAVIIDELAEKTQQPIIVFDPYKEYSKLTPPNNQNCKSPYKTVNITTDPKKTKLVQTIKPKQVTIITPENLSPENKGEFFSHYLKKLWNARLEQTICPFTLVVENPEKIDAETLEQVVYEGTKYDLALILITKQPTKIGEQIRAQMNTQIIGKTVDITFLKQIELIIPQFAVKVPHLKQREWIIVTNSQQQTSQITAKKL